MHLLASAGVVIWFALIGLLWFARPGEVAWFFGSLALAGIYFSAFFWYVTRRTSGADTTIRA
ncbi:MAG: hypothetical protein NTV56_23455 [Alphaproteobacteria bacterium]|nr:hypothetical protein [Alphaproteobacteria bacterium]